LSHQKKITMKITSKTKISKIITYDKQVIDVIASMNKHFKKLKNPILCKMLASRVSVADAAKIGGISTNEFLNILKNNGYDVELESDNKNKIETKQQASTMKKDKLVTLDARPILAGGVDPFDEIMKTLKTMSDDQTLLIINTFEPLPLLNILKKRGYNFETQRPEAGIVHCYIRKSDEAISDQPAPAEEKEQSFEDLEKQFAGKMKTVDVRQMEMPMPMVTILEELEKLSEGEALYVYHKRLPQYLLPELENRQFKLAEKKIDEDNLELIIYKS